MYVDTSISKRSSGTLQVRHLLRESHRINGKVVKKTIANISHLSNAEIESLRLALRHKDNLSELVLFSRDMHLQQGHSVGATLTLLQIADHLGISNALGNDINGKLALWQVMSRVLDQGSRLSATRLAQSCCIDQHLQTGSFNEDKLYSNLKWLSQNQQDIEKKLFKYHYKERTPSLYLYDVTSSYLEGTENYFGAFGYNRDGKKGKKQIVVGLLCDQEGHPLSIEVFPGNTQDPATVASQIRKAAERFGAKDVTFVGDRGMLKSKQITDLFEHKFHYITAITKPQIEALINQGTIQLGLFDTELAEVTENNVRYILRKNPVRAQEIESARISKLSYLQSYIQKKNQYLLEHPRARIETTLEKVIQIASKLGLEKYITINVSNRQLSSLINQDSLDEISKLDGCYVIKTDLTLEQASKETVHGRYKDLAMVEKAFRYSKTVELDLRPIFVRKEESTKAHAFVVMLAYQIIRYLLESWNSLDITVQEGINELKELCATDVFIKDNYAFTSIPVPRKNLQKLLSLCKVTMPKAITLNKSTVSTKTKLNNMRHLANNKRINVSFAT